MRMGGNEPTELLEGADIRTTHWQDARHWMSIPKTVRNHVRRLRKILTELEIPADQQARSWLLTGCSRRLDVLPRMRLLLLLPLVTQHANQRPCEVYPYARPFCFSVTS